MGKDSGVDWCDYSHGFWYGCRKVSPGCLNCYAERKMKRFGQDFSTVKRARGFDKPLKWKKPGLVFVCPESDFFIEDADPWRPGAWEIIHKTPHLTYLILTKRPENIVERLPFVWPTMKNVWLGVTAENQEMADKRIPILLQIPVTVRFVSVEPMIGQVDLRRIPSWHPNHGPEGSDAFCGGSWGHPLTRRYAGQDSPGYMNHSDAPTLDWVICGGESGPTPRLMKEEWATDLLDQCRGARVPFFMKQMSGKSPIPEILNVRDFPGE